MSDEDLRAMVATLLEHAEEWRFEEYLGREDNYCPGCGWSRRRDGARTSVLSHHAGCEYAVALRAAEAFVAEWEAEG